MIDSLLNATALPNLHPAVVHFPLAFFPLALAFEVAGLILRRQRWLAYAATTLYPVAALSAWLTVWAGERAADGLVAVPAAVQPRIGEHSDWAHYALYALATIAFLRLVVHLRPKLTDHRGARVVMVLLGLATLGVLARTADLGGALVYRHGVAVQRPAAEPEIRPVSAATAGSEEMATAAKDRLMHRDDGALVWRPNPGGRDALGEVLTAAPGSSLDTVRWVEDGDEGLTLDVTGSAILLFPGTFSDVQVEASVELLGFEGTVGLVHHLAPNGDGGFFAISTENTTSLSDVRGGKLSVLDQKATPLPEGSFTLAVSSAGRHLKGLLNAETVAHGHVAPGPAGACGFQLEGRGSLRILQASVIPLESH